MKNHRPISPHLTIYKPQLNSITSIMHRLTGIGLYIGLTMALWCCILYMFGYCRPCLLNIAQTFLAKMFLMLLVFGFTYHMCSGMRHLIWDTGRCYSIKAINISSLLVIFASLAISVIVWAIINQ